MKKIIVNNKGFSMIELMVVVAIIGVLAAIGIPQYSKFQAKARQSEAKLSLAALFTAEESFRQEWNQFSTNLNNVGFSVQGSRLRYKTGFGASACTGYATSGGAPTEVANVANTWSDGVSVNTSGATWAYTTTASTPTVSGTASNPLYAACATGAFTALAYGSPASSVNNPSATDGDTWSVNEVKLIKNTQVNLGN
jgi:type IV pilus assembly protein PilA